MNVTKWFGGSCAKPEFSLVFITDGSAANYTYLEAGVGLLTGSNVLSGVGDGDH